MVRIVHYIVFDLEWNQSPKGKEGTVDHLPFEIIEIGAVKLDEGLEQVGEFRQLICPRVYTQMHYKISEVTHLKMETLKRVGVGFGQAMERFLGWCGEDYRFVTWGSMDLVELQRNMVYHGLGIPFGLPLLYYDLQKLYSLRCGDGKQRISLDLAVEEQGISVEEKRPFHHALDDAYYTGQVMSRMGFEQVKAFLSVDYYQLPKTEGEEIYLSFPGYTKYVSRQFWSKEGVMADKRVNDVYCPCCRRALRKKIRWFAVNPKLYECLAICPEHGLVRGKIRIKKAEDGGVFAVRITKAVDEAGAQLVAEKRAALKQRKAEKCDTAGNDTRKAHARGKGVRKSQNER